MLYFNRNGVWFTIPIAKDAVYSRELLEKQIHTSLLGLQNLKDRSPGLDQMRFEKKNEYVIKSVFGRDDILIYPPTIMIKEKKKLKTLIMSDFFEYPVPCYDLVSGSYLARFWVGITNYWDDPSLSQEVNPITQDRHNTDFEITTYGNKTVFPLVRIGEPYWRKFPGGPRYSWCISDSDSSSSDPDTTWSPGPVSASPNWPWLVGDWHGTVSPVDFQEWGTSEIIKACDEDGEILRSNNLANLYDSLSDGGGPTAIYVGDSSPYSRMYYMYRWLTTYGYTITNMGYLLPGSCPFVLSNETFITDTEVHEIVSQTGLRIRTDNYSTTISLNGDVVRSGELSDIETISFLWSPLIISGNASISYSNNEPYLLEDAVVFNVEGWEDYSAWCILYYADVQNINYSCTATNTSDGKWVSDYNAAKSGMTFPGVFTVYAKVAGFSEEFILFQGDYPDSNWSYEAFSDHCEIYDFNKKPVYIFTVHIHNYDENRAYIIYAMIYNGVLYKSEEFETDDISANLATIYESVDTWGLKGYFWARAVGVRETIESEITIEE